MTKKNESTTTEEKSNQGKWSNISLNSLAEVFHQAKSTINNLETVFPFIKDSRKLTNKKILESLTRVGVATQSDLKALERRVDKLERELQQVKQKYRTSTAQGPTTKAQTENTATE